MDVPEPTKPEEPTQEDNLPEDVTKNQEQKTQEDTAQASTDTQSKADEKIIDYKQEYEKAQATIKKLQEENTKQDMSGKAPSEPLSGFDDLLRNMM